MRPTKARCPASRAPDLPASCQRATARGRADGGGTWQTFMAAPAANLEPVPDDVGDQDAAQFAVRPGRALRASAPPLSGATHAPTGAARRRGQARGAAVGTCEPQRTGNTIQLHVRA